MRSLTTSPPTLEELFLRHYRDADAADDGLLDELEADPGGRAMNALTGTGRLVRLALRRDRFVLAAWVVGLTVFLAMTTHMSVTGLPTQQDVVTRDAVHGRATPACACSASPQARASAPTR